MVLSSEQLQLLLKSARGVALVDLIKQSLIAPTIFHYEDIVQHPNVTQLATEEDEQIQKLINTLRLFTYGLDIVQLFLFKKRANNPSLWRNPYCPKT